MSLVGMQRTQPPGTPRESPGKLPVLTPSRPAAALQGIYLKALTIHVRTSSAGSALLFTVSLLFLFTVTVAFLFTVSPNCKPNSLFK